MLRHSSVLFGLWLASGCAALSEDAIMLSDLVVLSRAGGNWTASATSVSANVIAATSAVSSRFSTLDEHCVIYEDVTEFASEAGPASIELRSSQQTATAFLGAEGRYSITGLTANAAFADTDTLTASGDGGQSASIAAPPPSDPAARLGPPNGLSTLLQVPDGAYTEFYVAFVTNSQGSSGGMCHYPRETIPLSGQLRSRALFSVETAQALASRGMTPQTIFAAYYNSEDTSAFFPRAVPLQAGRMIRVAADQLAP